MNVSRILLISHFPRIDGIFNPLKNTIDPYRKDIT